MNSILKKAALAAALATASLSANAAESHIKVYTNVDTTLALMKADGSVVTGTNIENASYGLALCAETVAVAKAMDDGHRGGLEEVAVIGDTDAPVTPCGRCRQMLNELADLDEQAAKLAHRRGRVILDAAKARLLEAGASGYLGKAGDAAELIRAVRDVARGKRYLGSNVAQNLALHTVGGDASPFDALSPRELEVAMLLTQGLRQEDIARRLSLSAKTVNTHKARLFEKMGIHDNIALARMASQYGLVDPARPM